MATYEYQITIPSYRRAQTLKNKTLALLNSYGIPNSDVDVWLADEEQLSLYRAEFPLDAPNFIVGVPGIGAQRNHIEQYYDEGSRVLMLDDDLTAFKQAINPTTLEPVPDLRAAFQEGWATAEQLGAGLWGVYAVANPYFMKRRVQSNLCYVIGTVQGIVCSRDPQLQRITSHGEDYEYSIRRFIHDGILARLDWFTVISKYFKEPGGLVSQRTPQMMLENIKQIEAMFPDFCQMYIRKSTGYPELRLRYKPRP
jgi:hypothetical protein